MLKANYRLSHLLADLRFLYHFPGKMGPLVMWDFWTVFAYFFHSLALPSGHFGPSSDILGLPEHVGYILAIVSLIG